MFQMKHLCVVLLLPIILAQASYSGGYKRPCGVHAHYLKGSTKCVCDSGCYGDPYRECYYRGKGVRVIPLGPSPHQVKKFNADVNRGVKTILNDDRRIQAGEQREIEQGVRNDIHNIRKTNKLFNARPDIENLNDQADAAQRQGRRYNGRVGLGCGPFAFRKGSKCFCNPGCFGNPYKHCYKHCGPHAYRKGNACYCDDGYGGDPYKTCHRKGGY